MSFAKNRFRRGQGLINAFRAVTGKSRLMRPPLVVHLNFKRNELWPDELAREMEEKEE